MTISTQARTDINNIINTHGGSMLHYIATSGLLNEWGEMSNSAKYVGSNYIIGLLQKVDIDLSRVTQGDNNSYDSTCYTKSGTSYTINDKIVYKTINYEITNVRSEILDDELVFYRLDLQTLWV